MEQDGSGEIGMSDEDWRERYRHSERREKEGKSQKEGWERGGVEG